MEEIFLNLSTKFIINLPLEEQQSLERLCFQVEAAHWYYEDFIRECQPELPSYHLKQFSQQFFKYCPLLSKNYHLHEKAFADFIRYKTRVPVCGAIILNPQYTHCLLVKGWKQSSAWSFPKGKINLDEQHHLCAIREVLEETGYDCTSKLIETDFIDVAIKDQKIRLYLIQNVDMNTEFKTQTRKEISKIQWFKLTDLPSWNKNTKHISTSKFYLITPFIGRLKSFIKKHKPNAILSPDKETSGNPIDSLFSQLTTPSQDVSSVDALFSQCASTNVANNSNHSSHYGTPVASHQSPLQILQSSSPKVNPAIPSTAPLPNLQPFPPPFMPPKMPPVPSVPQIPSLPTNASTNVPINFLLQGNQHPFQKQQEQQHLQNHSQISTIMHPPSGITNRNPPQNLQQTLLETLSPNQNQLQQLQHLDKNDPSHKESLLSLLSPQSGGLRPQPKPMEPTTNPLLSLLNTNQHS
ncbi:DCP2-domain-containing protein [Wallemia mellicola]|uniref:DCP2-domain-containing protein n=1 Tax=Wallemia mellicola TaxID=1708541 RepID=A0A4T0TP30_9BASI|nr:DCP2-domain-containing protein [Wallemia mellicola]